MPLLVLDTDSAVFGDLHRVTPSIGQARDALLSAIISIGPSDATFPTAEIRTFYETVSTLAADAVTTGRLFNFGELPNQVIREQSKRGGPLYSQGHIGHPFRQPWVGFHTWEGGGSAYLVVPDPDANRSTGGWFHATEIMFHRLRERLIGLIGDAVHIRTPRGHDGTTAIPEHRWEVDLTASPAVLASGALREHASELASSVIDPVAAMMLILATDGVAVARVAPSPRLARARERSRKPPIPSYWQVDTAPYVTALRAEKRGAAEPGPGGPHRSPIPHLRRGHLRHKHERHGGGTVWVRDALVRAGHDSAPIRAFYDMVTEHAPGTPSNQFDGNPS